MKLKVTTVLIVLLSRSLTAIAAAPSTLPATIPAVGTSLRSVGEAIVKAEAAEAEALRALEVQLDNDADYKAAGEDEQKWRAAMLAAQPTTVEAFDAAQAALQAGQRRIRIRQRLEQSDPSLVAARRELLALRAQRTQVETSSRVEDKEPTTGPAPHIVADMWPNGVRQRRDEQLNQFQEQADRLRSKLADLSNPRTVRGLGGQKVAAEQRKDVSREYLAAKRRAEAFAALPAAGVSALFEALDETVASRVVKLRKIYGDAQRVGEETVRQHPDVLECRFKRFASTDRMGPFGSTEFEKAAVYQIQYRDGRLVATTEAVVDLVKAAEGCWVPRALLVDGTYRPFHLDPAAYYWEIGWDGQSFAIVQRN